MKPMSMNTKPRGCLPLGLVAAALLTGAATTATAATNVDVNVPTTATVVASYTATAAVQLSFGSFSVSGTGGEVVIDPSPSATTFRTAKGGVTLLGSSFSRGRVDLSGPQGASYKLTLPTDVTLSGPVGSMTLKPVTASAPGSSLDAITGAGLFYVGGTLMVSANQALGTYSGTVGILVTFE